MNTVHTTKRKILPLMIQELSKIYISEPLATFEKNLFHWNNIEGIDKENLARVEKIVKLSCQSEKIKVLAKQWITDDNPLDRHQILTELKYLELPRSKFLLIVDDLIRENNNSGSENNE